MINKDSLVKVLRLHRNMYGEVHFSEFVYGRVQEINELYDPPLLVEIVLPSAKPEERLFYRFWCNLEDVKESLSFTEIEVPTNVFGY